MHIQLEKTMERTKYKIDDFLVKGRIPESVSLSKEEFGQLWNAHPEELGKVKIGGAEKSTARWQKSYLCPYYFTGMSRAADMELPHNVQRLKQWVDGLGYGSFNQVLINWYKDGSHYISPHADSTAQLVPRSPIVSMSFGATRIFRIHRVSGGHKVKDYQVRDGDYIVMLYPMQSHFKHSIVKVTGSSASSIGPRVNVTFRQFKNG